MFCIESYTFRAYTLLYVFNIHISEKQGKVSEPLNRQTRVRGKRPVSADLQCKPVQRRCKQAVFSHLVFI